MHRLRVVSGPCIHPKEHDHFNTHRSGVQPLELQLTIGTWENFQVQPSGKI